MLMRVYSGAISSYDLLYDGYFIRTERHIVFPKLLAQNTHDYSTENTMYNKDADKAGTAR
jgi:hypothetical protein